MITKIRPYQSSLEEWFNSISHFIGSLLSIAALVILIIKSHHHQSSLMMMSSIFYGTSLILMYTASGLYHLIPYVNTKKTLKIIDHCCIYILIAGSYTPFCLLSIKGAFGWSLFGVIWACAVLGVVFKFFYTGRFPKLSLFLYIVMGWLAIVAIDPLFTTLTLNGMFWLIGGGLCYTIGVIFFVLDHKYYFAHFIWHLFVLAGSILHFFALLFFVYNYK